jgi:hypothetical protein
VPRRSCRRLSARERLRHCALPGAAKNSYRDGDGGSAAHSRGELEKLFWRVTSLALPHEADLRRTLTDLAAIILIAGPSRLMDCSLQPETLVRVDQGTMSLQSAGGTISAGTIQTVTTMRCAHWQQVKRPDEHRFAVTSVLSALSRTVEHLPRAKPVHRCPICGTGQRCRRNTERRPTSLDLIAALHPTAP